MNGFEQLIQLALLASSAAATSFAILSIRGRLRRFDGELYTVSAPLSAGAPLHFFESAHGLLRPALHRFLSGQPWLSLELVGRAGQVQFQIWIPTGERPFVESLLRAAYPGVELKPAPALVDDVVDHGRAVDGRVDRDLAHADVRLARGNYLPIQTTFESEPLSSLFWTLGRSQGSESITLQLLIKPKSSAWHTAAHLTAQALRDGQRGLRGILFGIPASAEPSQLERDRAKAIEEKATSLGFDCVLRVVATAERPEQAREFLRSVAASLRPFAAANSFDFRRVLRGRRFLELFRLRQFPPFGSFILNARELAALWHFPVEAPPQLAVIRSPKLPPPSGVSDGERLIGFSTYAEEGQAIRLSVEDSRRHLFLNGPTGVGKTTLMAQLALQDIAAGRGVVLLDPKVDLFRAVLERLPLPRERLTDVVVISSDGSELTPGINPLEVVPGADPDLVAENVLAIFQRIFAEFWGPRTSDILKATLLTLVRQPETTLAHIPLLLTDAGFRSRFVRELDDPVGLGSFWDYYERLTQAQQLEAIGPVLNKLREFLVRPRLRRLLCQPRSTIDLRKVVDGSGVLLADLSVGRWGETTSALIGSFLVSRIWQIVMARSSIPEATLGDCGLYVDEFQRFLGIPGPFADVLAQARSLHLSLTLGAQHTGQLPREVREAVAANARSKVIFQCGHEDAAYFAREFAPINTEALMSLPRFEAAARLSIHGETSRPFTLRTAPLQPVTDPDLAEEVVAGSQARYGRHIAVIDRELQAHLAPMGEPPIPELGVGRRRRR